MGLDPIESTFALPTGGPVKEKYGFLVETSARFVIESTFRTSTPRDSKPTPHRQKIDCWRPKIWHLIVILSRFRPLELDLRPLIINFSTRF